MIKTGSYSFFADEDIKVKDWKGLMSFLKMWKEKTKKVEEVKGWTPTAYDYYAKTLEIDTKNKTISFAKFDEWKIISYWYSDFCAFLNCLAKYIEGEVHWDFESHDESGWIEFEDGKCIAHTGVMEWSDWNIKENIDKKQLPKSIKEIMVLNEL